MVKHSQARPKITHHIAYICNEKKKKGRKQHCYNSKHSRNLSKEKSSFIFFSGGLLMIKDRLN